MNPAGTKPLARRIASGIDRAGNVRHEPLMDFDDQLRRYFGTSELSAITPAAMQGGIEHMAVELGLEKDRGRRFALWALMHMLGAAPDLDVAFKEAADRNSARDFMDMVDRANPT